MPEILDLRRADDPRDVIHRVCEEISQGRIVVLPTETFYTVAASALQPEAAQKVRSLGEAMLVVKSGEEARDYVDDFPCVARKLGVALLAGTIGVVIPGRSPWWFVESLAKGHANGAPHR